MQISRFRNQQLVEPASYGPCRDVFRTPIPCQNIIHTILWKSWKFERKILAELFAGLKSLRYFFTDTHGMDLHVKNTWDHTSVTPSLTDLRPVPGTPRKLVAGGHDAHQTAKQPTECLSGGHAESILRYSPLFENTPTGRSISLFKGRTWA